MTAVVIRPAQPTVDEGRRFAAYLDTAADGMFTFLVGKEMVRIVADAYVAPGHDLSFEFVRFAELDGEIVGMTSAYSSVDHAASSDRPLTRTAGWRTIRMAAVGALGWHLFRFIDTLPDGDFSLQAIAVDDDRRGLGIGGLLIADVEERARASNSSRLALDVAVTNEGARRLYERLGMSVEATSPAIPLAGEFTVQRMVKEL